jgi:uncharacterized membrane protein
MNRRQSIQRITRLGILMGLIILMTFIPNIGYIQTGLFSITTIHIPVLIGAALMGPIGGLVLGLTWGLTSYFYALTLGTIEAMIFLNPMVSIVPRVLVGLIVSYTTLALDKVNMKEVLKYGLVAGIGTLSNTVLVLSSIFIFASEGVLSFNQAFSTIITIIISTNGLLELFAAVIIVPAVVKAIRKISPQRYS